MTLEEINEFYDEIKLQKRLAAPKLSEDEIADIKRYSFPHDLNTTYSKFLTSIEHDPGKWRGKLKDARRYKERKPRVIRSAAHIQSVQREMWDYLKRKRGSIDREAYKEAKQGIHQEFLEWSGGFRLPKKGRDVAPGRKEPARTPKEKHDQERDAAVASLTTNIEKARASHMAIHKKLGNRVPHEGDADFKAWVHAKEQEDKLYAARVEVSSRVYRPEPPARPALPVTVSPEREADEKAPEAQPPARPEPESSYWQSPVNSGTGHIGSAGSTRRRPNPKLVRNNRLGLTNESENTLLTKGIKAIQGKGLLYVMGRLQKTK